jgi:hypothetical protein
LQHFSDLNIQTIRTRSTIRAIISNHDHAALKASSKLAFFEPKAVAVPTNVRVFPDEISPAPRRWVKKAYPKLIYYQRHPKGAHFAAWEQPGAIVNDLRAGFRSLRVS